MTKAGFEHLIAPTSLGDFFERYWEKRPLRTERCNTGHYDGIIDVAAIDRLFSNRQHASEYVRVILNGSEVPPSIWSETITLRDGRTAQVADFAKVLGHFHRGASIVINGAHRSMPELRVLCDHLSDELGFDLQTNIYITPSESQAFDPHYDLHDTFLMQIAGNKRWRVYHQTAEYPVEQTGTDQKSVDGTDPEMEFVLEQGEALYIPSGFIHAATTSDRASVHITLGFKPKRRYELLEDMLKAAKDKAELRRALPLKVLPAGRQATEWAETRKLFEELWSEVWAHSPNMVAVSPPSRGEAVPPELSRAISIDEIGTGTVVCLTENAEIEPCTQKTDIVLRAGMKKATVARIFEPTISTLLSKKPVAVGEFSGLLTDSGKVEFAKTLAQEGLLEIVRG